MTATKGLPGPRPDRGSVLVVALVAIIVMTGISMAYFSTSLVQNNRSFQDSLVVKATYVATCGINAAIVDLNESRSGNLDGNAYYPNTIANRTTGAILFSSATNPTSTITDVPPRATYSLSANKLLAVGARPSGDFTTTSTLNADGTYTVTSSGVFDRKVVTIESVLKKNPTTFFTFAAFGKDGVTANGSIFTDSYDSRKGSYASQAVNTINIKGNNETYAGVKGDLGSNGTVVTNGAANAIFGSVSPGPGQTFTPTGFVYGSTAPLPTTRNLPSYVYQLPATYTDMGNINGGTLTSGVYRASSLDGKVTIDGDVKMYLEGDSSMTGQEVININANASLEIYVKQGVSVKFAGNGVLNASTIPDKFKIYSASTADLDLTGNSIFYGIAYAPDSDIKISGNAQNYGAMVGRILTLCGGGTRGGFHYDEALAEVMGTVTKYSIQSMRTALTQSY